MQMIDRIAEILKTEYSTRFDKIRKDMVVTSFYKYGPIRENYGSGHSVKPHSIFLLIVCLPFFIYRCTDGLYAVSAVGTAVLLSRKRVHKLKQ